MGKQSIPSSSEVHQKYTIIESRSKIELQFLGKLHKLFLIITADMLQDAVQRSQSDKLLLSETTAGFVLISGSCCEV